MIKFPKINNFRSKIVLLIVAASIGLFTTYGVLNTYEVVSGNDIPLSTVLKTIHLTVSDELDSEMRKSLRSSYDTGSFGVPKVIQFPETKQIVNITAARYGTTGWIASNSLAQVFIASNPEQKVFGSAVIYMRYNTLTTQHLGYILNGDIINIVTTDGWQLGYEVHQISSDPSNIDSTVDETVSKIIVIMVDEYTQSVNSFEAALVKVGGRV